MSKCPAFEKIERKKKTTTQEVSAVAFRTLQLMSFSRAHCNAKTLAIEKTQSLGLSCTRRCSQSITSREWLTVEYYSYLVQNEFQEKLQELDFPPYHISMPSFPDIFIRITRGVPKKRDLFCLLLVPVKLHFVRHMKVFMFLSCFNLFRRITNLNISPQQDGKCRFINLSLSLEKLQQSS